MRFTQKQMKQERKRAVTNATTRAARRYRVGRVTCIILGLVIGTGCGLALQHFCPQTVPVLIDYWNRMK